MDEDGAAACGEIAISFGLSAALAVLEVRRMREAEYGRAAEVGDLSGVSEAGIGPPQRMAAQRWTQTHSPVTLGLKLLGLLAAAMAAGPAQLTHHAPQQGHLRTAGFAA